jgi:hypothetical protein
MFKTFLRNALSLIEQDPLAIAKSKTTELEARLKAEAEVERHYLQSAAKQAARKESLQQAGNNLLRLTTSLHSARKRNADLFKKVEAAAEATKQQEADLLDLIDQLSAGESAELPKPTGKTAPPTEEVTLIEEPSKEPLSMTAPVFPSF